MKAIVVFALSALIVITVATAGTIYLGEPVIVEHNQATAATLRLNITGDFNISDMMPGTNRSATVNIENLGTINGTLKGIITNITGPENTLLESERDTGDNETIDLGCDKWQGDGELDNTLIEIKFEFNNTVISELDMGDLFEYNLLPGEKVSINMTVFWPRSEPPRMSDESAQSDSINVTINWRIENGFSDSRTTEFAITAGTWEEEK